MYIAHTTDFACIHIRVIYKNGKNDSILITNEQYKSSPKYLFVDTASNLSVDTASQKSLIN